MKGYLGLIAIILVMALLSVCGLRMVEREYEEITRYQNQQITTQQVISAHYKWLEQLSGAITTRGDFQGSLDPSTCALGSWITASAGDVERYPEIKAALDEITAPHEELHLEAAELLELAKRDREAAFKRYQSDFQPKVETIGAGLGKISGAYQSLTDAAAARVRTVALATNIFSVAIGILAAVSALLAGRRTSRRIAKPILAVAEWSEQLSSGVDNLKFDVHSIEDQHNTSEVGRMIRAFQEMAQSIRDNVSIIQKVAEGDLTAYVDIRSAGDSLGRNLYHLVQNNDQMFAGLLRVADSVATNAEHIASASQALAQSSTEQASAVDLLSVTVDRANRLAAQNAEKATHTAEVIQGMQGLVQEGKGRMDALTDAVEGIREASEKISLVMKSINDIAFQTNILALNAAVEAARAGAAGKGFAVVADEVRNLSMKSAEAADQSRDLIEDTIRRVRTGSEIASEATEVFRVVAERAPGVTGLMDEISGASDSQQQLMDEINGAIAQISSVVQQNAASSEETAAATQQMTANAEVIRREMRRFNLRNREEGKPYIPPEKANDEEFIRVATENYLKAKRAGGRPSGKAGEPVLL